jgi:hypothetical protein
VPGPARQPTRLPSTARSGLPVSRCSHPAPCVRACLSVPSLFPVESVARQGRTMPPVPAGRGPLPTGRCLPVGRDPPLSLSQPPPATWHPLVDHLPPPHAGIKWPRHHAPCPVSFLPLSLFFLDRASTRTPPQPPYPQPVTGGLWPAPDFARTAPPSAFVGECLPSLRPSRLPPPSSTLILPCCRTPQTSLATTEAPSPPPKAAASCHRAASPSMTSFR